MFLSKNSYYKTKKHNGYDSKFEAGKAAQLELLLKAGEIKDFETQVPIDIVVNGYKVCTYVMDFIVYENDGSKTWIETKGFATDVWKLKWKLLEAMYGDRADIQLVVEFQGKGKAPKPGKWKSGIQF